DASRERTRDALHSLDRWRAERDAARLVHAVDPIARGVRTLLRRMDALVARGAPHRRPSLAMLARDLNRLTLSLRGRGAEDWLARLVSEEMSDWIFEERVREAVRDAPAATRTQRDPVDRSGVIALIILTRAKSFQAHERSEQVEE